MTDHKPSTDIELSRIATDVGFSPKLQWYMPQIEMNALGLPIGVYRADLLDLSDPHPSKDVLDAAYVKLNYGEGFPTFPDGRPLWFQWDIEAPEAFKAYELYQNMPKSTASGIRRIYDVPAQFAEMYGSDRECTSGDVARCSQWYYWESRAKAFDLFEEARARKEQRYRQENLTSDHELKMERIMSRLMIYMNPDDPENEFWELLPPKAAIDLLKMLMQAQRVNVGLPGAAPLAEVMKDESQARGQSLEVVMRGLSGGFTPAGALIEGTVEEENSFERLLGDADFTELAQDLVIKIQSN